MFCGDEQVEGAAEHVPPEWLRLKLRYYALVQHPDVEPEFIEYQYGDPQTFSFDLAEGTGDHAHTTTYSGGRPTAHLGPDVCVTCNRGWMSNLEEAAKKLIPGLLEGRSKFLAPFDQFVFATWIVKTALVYDATYPQRMVPEEVSRELFLAGHPPLGCAVTIGNSPGHVPEGAFLHGRRHVALPGPQPKRDAVEVAFQFDSLITYAVINFGQDLQDGIGAAPNTKPPYYERIWPPGERLWWPSDASRVPRSGEATNDRSSFPVGP
jgi:hypothetical protein